MGVVSSLGQPVRRREDARLLAGRGEFLDDIRIDGTMHMAFVRSPDKHSIELLQKGQPLPPKEPWSSMPNTGHW